MSSNFTGSKLHNIIIIIMFVLFHSLGSNSLTDESIPHLTELIESARNLERLDLLEKIDLE